MKALRNNSWLLGLGMLAACGGAQQVASDPDKLSVDRLYPLRAGSVWTYDVDTGQGPPVLAITRVLSAEGGRVEVSSGSTPVEYEVKPDGLYRPDRGGFVLKAPIQSGARWDAGAGVTAEVTRTDVQVTSPAGAFAGCAEVVETGGQTQKVVRTVFCPDVGPVEVESSMGLELSGAVRVLARLRGYDFSGALVAASPPSP